MNLNDSEINKFQNRGIKIEALPPTVNKPEGTLNDLRKVSFIGDKQAVALI